MGQHLSNHLLRYLHLLISLLTSDSLNSLLLGLQLFCGSYLPVVLQVANNAKKVLKQGNYDEFAKMLSVHSGK